MIFISLLVLIELKAVRVSLTAFLLNKKYNDKKSVFFKGLLENILVIYVSSSMFLYGIMKYIQFGFNQAPYTNEIIGDLTNMQLMWAFYGRTLSFPLIIGCFEILGAGLLFFRKTRIIGCFLLTSILINIIIQDIIFDVLLGALISAIFYQIIIIYILWIHRLDVIKAFVIVCNVSEKKTFTVKVLHLIIGLAISVIIKMTLGL